ncbi:hypothetical protein JUN65_04345 [Gluconacetobacter azotocaptans]|uniref:hypothetical protein n=1 Tax=Gluconacetobacter azotocaptans TaxID=142834 RepID=UPI0019570151|nr:hypothetical protein [Gluconacetobacter azotocaptans]MBM9400812.1 hypothetical protein [Gluconacetobacter azotocaptans]
MDMPVSRSAGSAVADAARLLLPLLEQGCPIDADGLREAMTGAFQGADSAGIWNWKTAYDETEATAVLFLRRFGSAMSARAASAAAMLALFATFERLLDPRVEAAIAADTHDSGLETLRADSFSVLARQTIHVHPETGARTDLLTIRERRRTEPVTLGHTLSFRTYRDAMFVHNAQSGRAAVRIPAPVLITDGGDIQKRVRLIRPMDTQTLSLDMFIASYWEQIDAARFAPLREAELAQLDEFVETTVHMVTGLLLPIWKRLPSESTRVYRLQTDEGERIIGRRVSPAWAATASVTGGVTLSGPDARRALLEGAMVIHLAERMRLRRVRVMGNHRIELTGFTEAMRERLRVYGLFTEIISWTLRFFVPVDEAGGAVLDRLFETWPVERVAEREAA